MSALVRQRVTDTTSGFQAVNRLGIRLFAADYPHDYPEVEATVLLYKHQLRLCEVPVAMRARETGRSSITAVHSVYYMVKVLLAIFVAIKVLNRLHRREEAKPAAPPRQELLLEEIRDLLKRR